MDELLNKMEEDFKKSLAAGKEDIEQLFSYIKEKMSEYLDSYQYLNGKVSLTKYFNNMRIVTISYLRSI